MVLFLPDPVVALSSTPCPPLFQGKTLALAFHQFLDPSLQPGPLFIAVYGDQPTSQGSATPSNTQYYTPPSNTIKYITFHGIS